MRYISKQGQPQELIAWLRAPAETESDDVPISWGYDDMPTDVYSAVLASLVREQGGLCCYTGRRITIDSSHVEHLRPQNPNVENVEQTSHEDTDYTNLLAAFPAPNGPGCRYGAHPRGNWHDETLFVHPLRRDCENRFRFQLNGKMGPASNADAGASETIKRLVLNHAELVEMRKAAIDAAIFDAKLSKAQIQRLRDAMDQRDGKGHFRPFCFAIKQACEKYLKRFDK